MSGGGVVSCEEWIVGGTQYTRGKAHIIHVQGTAILELPRYQASLVNKEFKAFSNGIQVKIQGISFNFVGRGQLNQY